MKVEWDSQENLETLLLSLFTDVGVRQVAALQGANV